MEGINSNRIKNILITQQTAHRPNHRRAGPARGGAGPLLGGGAEKALWRRSAPGRKGVWKARRSTSVRQDATGEKRTISTKKY